MQVLFLAENLRSSDVGLLLDVLEYPFCGHEAELGSKRFIFSCNKGTDDSQSTILFPSHTPGDSKRKYYSKISSNSCGIHMYPLRIIAIAASGISAKINFKNPAISPSKPVRSLIVRSSFWFKSSRRTIWVSVNYHTLQLCPPPSALQQFSWLD